MLYTARIRNDCSNLLSNLYINHLSPSPACSCSEEVEGADHYFFNCPNYNNERDAPIFCELLGISIH